MKVRAARLAIAVLDEQLVRGQRTISGGVLGEQPAVDRREHLERDHLYPPSAGSSSGFGGGGPSGGGRGGGAGGSW